MIGDFDRLDRVLAAGIEVIVMDVRTLRQSAQNVIDAWDQGEWEEHAGDGELADAIRGLRKVISGGQ